MNEGFSPPFHAREERLGPHTRARDYAQLTTAMCMGPGLCAVNEQLVSFHRSDQLLDGSYIAFDPELWMVTVVHSRLQLAFLPIFPKRWARPPG